MQTGSGSGSTPITPTPKKKKSQRPGDNPAAAAAAALMREALCGGAVGPPKSSHATSMCHQPLASIPRLASWPPSFLPLVLYNQTIHIQSGGDRRLGSLRL
ncbi:hypothetical protein BS78_K100700 [Paspalum vaginatum]|uniref:Uncharacterized protein n=1 Tax=Paspalum vaginatum TaxID=158149 RepID=A0A9W7X8E8_9POAL|nr:hypothetical protein BS78_K100700 [Paspalum vaginatum]